MSADECDGRSLAERVQKPRVLTAREQLALTLLYDEWSNRELSMCFETENPEQYVTDLSTHTARQIGQYEVERDA